MKLERYWYRPSLTFLTTCLLPLSWLFRVVIAMRRFCYRIHLKKSYRFSVPVIVVGNITVGGTGKTPCVLWLTAFLRTQGYKPGIVTRGVGGKQQAATRWVSTDSDVNEVGDEAVLLAKRSQCPVVIGIDRVAAVKELLAKTDCNIVISDDGLQHYRLQRDIEIIMIDSMRGLGNQQLLPAGPLREPANRLNTGIVILNRAFCGEGSANRGRSFGVKSTPQDDKFSFSFEMTLAGDMLMSIQSNNLEIPISQFKHKRIHAVAAIGNPDRFFMMLREKGFDVIEHPFTDHYLFSASDLQFDDDLPIIMTEKDAVKCYGLVDERFWYIPVEARMDEAFSRTLVAQLSS